LLLRYSGVVHQTVVSEFSIETRPNLYQETRDKRQQITHNFIISFHCVMRTWLILPM